MLQIQPKKGKIVDLNSCSDHVLLYIFSRKMRFYKKKIILIYKTRIPTDYKSKYSSIIIKLMLILLY